MTGPAPHKSKGVRVVQTAMLLALFGLAWAVTRHVPGSHSASDIVGAIGFLLLAGTLMSEVLEEFGLPHLTGYILAGVLAGPHVGHFLDHDTVEGLGIVGTLALALIALAGGAELRLAHLREGLKLLAIATGFQTVIVFLVAATAYVLLARFMPFMAGQSLGFLLAAGILWGVIAVSRSPSATLAILSQTRADGPVTRFSLAFVMSSDVVVLVLLAVATLGARQLVDPSAVLSLQAVVAVGHELLSSISLGVTVGVLLALYLRFVGTELLIVLVTLGFGLTYGLRYLHFDPLLTFLSAGFFVQNFSNQGKKLLHAVGQTSALVFVVFFAAAGAHLDLPLLKQLWPLAVGLCVIRAAATILAHRLACRSAKEQGPVRSYGASGLISQAGLTLGIAIVVERQFPSFGAGLRSLAIATVAINEIAGPVLFKLALDRSHESAASTEPELEPAQA